MNRATITTGNAGPKVRSDCEMTLGLMNEGDRKSVV